MKKYLFIIQGEGRGHLTQAISLKQIIEQSKNEVVGVLVGTNKTSAIPTFFEEQIGQNVQYFNSPSLEFNSAGKIDFVETFLHHVKKTSKYLKSLEKIDEVVKRQQPDVIINFYEILGGLYKMLYRPNVPVACIGHHYLFLHSSFDFPANKLIDRFLLKANTKLTAFGAKKQLALSFRNMEDEDDICVVPPLIRKEIKTLNPQHQPFWLVYVTYPHFKDAIIAWHKENPTTNLYCFWNHEHSEAEYRLDETLTVHQLDGTKFLQKMAECEAVVSTSGFESVCEAMYLGKPVMMVPSHYEQLCNGLDAVSSGAGVRADSFNLDIMRSYLPTHQSVKEEFKNWYVRGDYMLMRHLNELTAPKKQSKSWFSGFNIFKPKRLTIPT